MLQQMRDWFRYLKWLLVIIIFMFVWWAFATWGGGTSRGRQDADWAAKVNGVAISRDAFIMEARQLDNRYQQIFGEQYAQQRAFVRVGLQSIGSLVDRELLYQEAQRQGITLTSQEVAESIMRQPQFQENGLFIGLDRYQKLLQAYGYDVGRFEAEQRRSLLIAKFSSMITDSVTVSDAEVEREFLRRNEKSTVDYLIIDPAKVGSKRPPADHELRQYYEGHTDRYTRGEGRTGMLVTFSPKEAAATQNVSDEEVAAAYERDKATRYSAGEQRCAAHILLKVGDQAAPDAAAKIEKKAGALLKRAKAGENFEGLARKYSEDSSAANGGDLGCFPRGQMVKEFEDTAFSLSPGQVSNLVRTRFGFHIIKVKDIRPPHTTSLDEARETIREELKLERARGETQKRAAEFARASAGGKLEAVAKSQGLTIQETGDVREGAALPGLPASQAVVSRMLALAPGEVSEPIPTATGQVVVQVTGTTPPAVRPFEEVRAQVLKDVDEERALRAVADTIQAGRRSGGLKAVARALAVDQKSQSDVTRDSSLAGVPPDAAIAKQIGSLPPGTIGDPLKTSAGIVVLSVKERRDHKEDFPSQKDSISDNLVRQRQDRLERALVKSLRERGNVEVNQALVDSLDRV
jgi:peptidyl-prolyl cis-trans isomerase D